MTFYVLTQIKERPEGCLVMTLRHRVLSEQGILAAEHIEVVGNWKTEEGLAWELDRRHKRLVQEMIDHLKEIDSL